MALPELVVTGYPPEDLVFDVHMALRGSAKLWPKRNRPCDHDRLRPMAKAIVEHLELCGIRCFRRPPPEPHSYPGRSEDPPA